MAVAEDWKDKENLKKIYVGQLKEDTEEDRLKEYFGQYGEITDLNIVRHPDGKSRRCGFIKFADSDVVDNILFNFESHNIDGKKVDVRRAIPKDEPDPYAHIKTKKLFIGGLKDDQTEEHIKTALATFIPFEPNSVQLMRDRETNKFKGFAFVNFDNEHIVDKLFLIRKVLVNEKQAEMKKAHELGTPGGEGGRGGRGGPRRGMPRGRGRGAGGGGSGGSGGGGYGGMGDGYGSGYGGGYEGYGGYGGTEGYDGYRNTSYYGYNSYGGGYGGSGGGGYGNGYGDSSGGGGGGMGHYSQEQSGYGPSRGRGRGSRGAAGGGYRPY